MGGYWYLGREEVGVGPGVPEAFVGKVEYLQGSAEAPADSWT